MTITPLTAAPRDDRRSPELVGHVVSDDLSPSFSRLRVRLMPGVSLGPGSFLLAALPDAAGSAAVVVRVNDVHEVNPHEDAASATIRNVLPFDTSYAPEGRSTSIYRLADVEPLEQVSFDQYGALTVTNVTAMSFAGAAVWRAGEDVVVATLGTRRDPDDGLHIGATRNDATIPVVLDRSVVQRHIFIAGGIGSGKSYTRGVLAEELAAWGVPQVNLDVNGEMVAAAQELGGVNVVPGRGFTIPLSALSSQDVVAAVPSINPNTNMETLLRYAHEALLRDVAQRRIQHFSVDDLVEQIEKSAEVLHLKERRTVEPTKLRTRSLNRLTFIGQPYDWPNQLRPGAFINIDCRGLPLGELRLVAASVARDLQQLARAKRIPFTVLSIDEFHLVAPADDNAVTTQVLREIARIGRHYRLGLILTTQSPADVDRSILKRLLTRFLHAIEPDQLNALRGVFSDASEDLVHSLPKLPQGSCVVTGAFETVRHATAITVRTRQTTHGGATPDIWADLAARGWSGKHQGP